MRSCFSIFFYFQKWNFKYWNISSKVKKFTCWSYTSVILCSLLSTFIWHWNIVLLQRSPRCVNLGLKHYMLKPIQRIPQYKLLLQGKALNSWGTMPLKQEVVIYHWNKIVLFLSALVTSVKFSMRIWFLFSFIEIHLFQSTCNFHDESCQ